MDKIPDDEERERREAQVLKRLLATPPDHKTKVKSGASSKKRGRPPKRQRDAEE